MNAIASLASRSWNAIADMLFACGRACCGLDRFYWFNVAAGLRG